jgi:LAO/AO transport system kinase
LARTANQGIDDLASRIRAGDRRALSRGISWIEDQTPEGRGLLDRLFDPTPRSHRVGITGPPGSGKSTLTSELTRSLRNREASVGILAVDPSSPFTGGAILGDRIRMQAHHGDPGVFIRSMASRGSLGGLASTTYEASEALEAAGCAWILIETVGVGQSEMEIIEAADTTVVVLVPESGDAVQVMKAGLMEAADLFVINKFDREGGDRLEKEILLMLELERDRRREEAMGGTEPWEPRICRTVATRGEGVDDLRDRIEAHRDWIRGDPAVWAARRRKRVAQRLRTLLRDRLLHGLWRSGELDAWVGDSEQKVDAGEASPYALVDAMVSRLLAGGNGPHPVGAGRGSER